ncbi:MAG: hypothetical protein WAM82_32660 [Thermoanaerobaculia bacterium]
MSRCAGIIVAVLTLVLASGPAFAAEKPAQSFGAFVVKCDTDQGKARCQIMIQPATGYYSENGVLPFVVFIYPDGPDIITSNGIRLKVDQQEFLEGDCRAVCEFKDVGGFDVLFKGLETGATLHVGAKTYRTVDKGAERVLTFDLNDYRKALAVYREMRGPISDKAAVDLHGDSKKIFGNFTALCTTDKMTDARNCEVRLAPPVSFFAEHNLREAFLVSISPDELTVDGVGFPSMLRVDKNLALAGKCVATSVGICQFPKPESFIRELSTGKTLLVQVGATVYEFGLDEYRKALAAYREMKGPVPVSAPKR